MRRGKLGGKTHLVAIHSDGVGTFGQQTLPERISMTSSKMSGVRKSGDELAHIKTGGLDGFDSVDDRIGGGVTGRAVCGVFAMDAQADWG